MKKLLLILLCLPFIGFGQQTYVPDDNFEAYLESNGMGNGITNDNSVTTANINTVGSLNVNYQFISDLTGIEAFTALVELWCEDNQLTSLDLSNNTALTNLFCNNNQITSLDVSQNTALTQLWCEDNQLTSLDVSQNTALTQLWCDFNQLTSLNVSGATALTILVCGYNQLTSFDVSQNTALTGLWCYWNYLTSLDVSNNTYLTELYCTDNNLTSLDVRNGNNTNITDFWADNNPNLFCIDVDDPVWSTINWTTSNGNIDPQISFSTNCNPVGCTDSLACNYTPLATIDDGSCGYNTASFDTLSVTASIVWNGMPLNISGDYSVTLTNSVGCDSIVNLNLTITIPSGILNITNTEKTLLKITDILGSETPYKKRTPLFYIYDDGTVEKRIVIE